MDLLTLYAKIALDTKEYSDGLGEAESKASTFGGKLKNGLATAGKVAGTAIAAAGAAATAASAAMVNATTSVANYGDNIDKMSQKLGLSTDAYQEWDFIMQHSGSSIEGLQSSMKTLANAAVDGKDSFEKLGLSLEDVQSMSQEDLFSTVITSLQSMEEGTERTALASDLLGKAATELAPLLNTSAEETEAMKKQVHELGGVMSEDAVKASAAFNDSMQNLQTGIAGLSRGVVSDFMPSIVTVMDGLTALVTGDEGGLATINQGVADFVQKLIDTAPQLIDVGMELVLSLTDAIIDNLPQIIEAGFTLITKLIVGILSALPSLIAKAPEIIGAIITGLVNAWPQIKEAGADLVTKVGEGLESVLEKAKTWGKDLIDNFINGIKSKLTDLKNTVGNVAQTVKDFLGFSEPKSGPLSNFHTYAPDMMQLFAKGIRDNEDVVSDQIAKSFDFGTQTVDYASSGMARMATGGISGGGMGEIVLNITSEIDGAVLARKQYRHNMAEAARHGASLVY